MKNPFTGLFRARDKPKDSVSAAPTFFFGMSGSGKPVNAQTAIQLSTVYACVRVISETVASLPLGVFEMTDDGSRKATDHPLYPLLHDEPNSEMTSFVLREVMLAHLLLWGKRFITEMYETFGDDVFSTEMVIATLDYSGAHVSAYLHQFTLLRILDCRKEDVYRYQFLINPEEHPEYFEPAA